MKSTKACVKSEPISHRKARRLYLICVFTHVVWTFLSTRKHARVLKHLSLGSWFRAVHHMGQNMRGGTGYVYTASCHLLRGQRHRCYRACAYAYGCASTTFIGSSVQATAVGDLLPDVAALEIMLLLPGSKIFYNKLA